MIRAVLPLLLFLAACSTGPDRAALLNPLIGRPEADVVRALGVPSRTYETGGHKFLAYTQQSAEVLPGGGPFLFGGGGFYGGGFGLGPGFGYAGAFPTEIIPRTCETTFDVAGGQVLSWSLRGNAC